MYDVCTHHVPLLCYYYVNLRDDCLPEIKKWMCDEYCNLEKTKIWLKECHINTINC